MTDQAVVRRALLLVAIDAESHGVIDDALGHRHLRQIAVAVRAFDLRANVRRMIEPNMRLFDKSIHTLPRDIFAALGGRAQRLDARVGGIADVFMAAHTYIDAWDSGARAL